MTDSIIGARQNKTVLIISDVQEQFGQTVSLLEQEGHRVLFQKKIASFDEIKYETPSLLICELAAPDIDGPRICRQVRNDLSNQKVPVLLVGDLPKGSSIVEESLQCGATDYLQKPMDSLELAYICREMLGSKDAAPKVTEQELSPIFEAASVPAMKWKVRLDLISAS
jgi:DNA-binding response OmpR family regulator